METYKTILKEVRVRDEVYCDCCGRKIDTEGEDYLHLEKQWGYFSQKDGENHVLDICEECYDKWRSCFSLRFGRFLFSFHGKNCIIPIEKVLLHLKLFRS